LGGAEKKKELSQKTRRAKEIRKTSSRSPYFSHRSSLRRANNAQNSRKTSAGGRISVIISGMPSVGKTTAANAISTRFRLRLLAGGDMLKEMAIERGYAPSGSEWWDGKEGMRFLSERKLNPNFDREVDRRLIENVRRGGVVVTSYTLPWLCKDGLKIWFGASRETRARRLANRDGISFAEALSTIKKRDSQNRRLYSELYGIEFGKDLSVFNYILETDTLSAKQVADVSCKIVHQFQLQKNSRRHSDHAHTKGRNRIS